MDALIEKYADKLIQSGLGKATGSHQPLVGGLDDTLVWSRCADEIPTLEKIFSEMNINSLVFLRPAPPYTDVIRHLARQALSTTGLIEPKDCETRTFLHDLPVINTFDHERITGVLKQRKSVIILPEKDISGSRSPIIIAHGSVSPEQGFVTISSVCFACYIKYFADYLDHLKLGIATQQDHERFDTISGQIKAFPKDSPALMASPFKTDQSVYDAIIEAGFKTVEYELVDSYFGNVSYCWNNTLYISQTGSSLDELAGCIDPVPLDNSTSAGLTASSELTAHLKTIEITGNRAILHGHPKFCVILSMDCDPIEKKGCQFKDECHIKCPKKRFIQTVPIVPGEVGTGSTGLCHTLPPALSESNAAIVYGHGLFTTGKNDFSDAFKTMLEVEELCRETYFSRVAELR